MREIPQEHDWVTATVNCSAEQVLKQLEIQVTYDVDARNHAKTPVELQYGVQFGMPPANVGFQVVAWQNGEPVAFAKFRSIANKIQVKYKDGRILEAKPTHCSDGECRLVMSNTDELELWQFRKIILSEIFFEQFKELNEISTM